MSIITEHMNAKEYKQSLIDQEGTWIGDALDDYAKLYHQHKLSEITEEKIKKTIEETEYDMHVSEEVHSSYQRYDILAKAITKLLKEER